MSDETHDLLRMARENYGWIGVSMTFCTLMLKPVRRFFGWLFGWIYKPIVVIERLVASVDVLASRIESVDNRLASMDGRLLGLETVITKAVTSAEAANVRARLAFEESPIGHFECDLEGRCVWVNSALSKLFGLSRERMLGTNGLGWMEALHPEDGPTVYRNWTETVEHWRPYKVRYRIIREDKPEPLTVEATASVMQSESKHPICIWGRVVPLPTVEKRDTHAA
jgi:PAS domain S-box-containing protein